MKILNPVISKDRFNKIDIIECDVETGFWRWKTVEHKKFFGNCGIWSCGNTIQRVSLKLETMLNKIKKSHDQS